MRTLTIIRTNRVQTVYTPGKEREGDLAADFADPKGDICAIFIYEDGVLVGQHIKPTFFSEREKA